MLAGSRKRGLGIRFLEGNPLSEIEVPVDLPRAVEAAIERSIGLVGMKPVSVIAEYPAHLPAAAGEQSIIAGLIASLIAYAISITERGEIRVRAELLRAGEKPATEEIILGEPENLAEVGPWAMMLVTTTGTPMRQRILQGIREDILAVSKEPQLSRDALPLSLCKERIESFGGMFWAENLSGRGVRLAFALPLLAAPVRSEGVSSLRQMVETRFPEAGTAEKSVLLLVDDLGLRDWLGRDLADGGYQVLVESDGGNVLSLARAQQPDLILLDLDARDPSAFDVAAVLKQDAIASSIPLLFITSVADPNVGVRMEPVDFLVRSGGTGRLSDSIKAVLNSGLSPASARVLVIEQEDATREAMILMIQAHGYRVTEAKAPEEALALAERLEPRLVLVNSELAEERDYWLLRGLRQLSHNMQIFVLAEFLTEAEGKAAMSRGASGYSETGRLRELLDIMRTDQGPEAS